MGEMAEDFAFMKEQKRKERQGKEPRRMEYALKKLRDAGYTADASDYQTITVYHNHGYVTLWAYTGWYSGKGIGNGRGIENLLKTLEKGKHENY